MDVAFNLQNRTEFSGTHIEKDRRLVSDGKFIFCVLRPAFCHSFPEIYRLQTGGVSGWLSGCGSGGCPSFRAANSPCLLALGAEYQQGWGAEGAERSEIDEVGFWRKLSWEAVWVCEAGERTSGSGVSLVNGRCPWKKPAGVG